jgi:hypothetical protein
MASSLAQIRSGLKDRLETITALGDVHAYQVDAGALNKFPTAIMLMDEAAYAQTAMGGTPMEVGFRVIVLVARADTPEGFEALDEFIDAQGARSIDRAIEGARNLGLTDVTAALVRCERVGIKEIGQGRFYGGDFLVRVVRTG